ncbi:VQ motif-containing protein 10-like [Beta vulgaris subsp. vulgaris]|uniref:VQ motif-containing protein 10-like n=1 Tax=Beta vulgaris subsp. vulgaris TaxID=3555 RepID=UPI000540327D|nr:VQ motif-containing protein 10-like [Beta vulgaris subsp. vulgaris]
MDEKGNNVKPTKVTFIGTRNVIVEAKDFKSMVQSLTGKNSSVAWVEGPSYACSLSGNKRKVDPGLELQPQRQPSDGSVNHVNNDYVDCSGDVDGGFTCLSTADLDEMLRGLPLMEELKNWAQNDVINN